MIRKVYVVDFMLCPKCGRTTKVIAFITDYAAVDRIIDNLKLTLTAERPTSPERAVRELFMDAEPWGEE